MKTKKARYTGDIWKYVQSEYKARFDKLLATDSHLVEDIEDPRNNLGAERFPPEMIEAVLSIKLVLVDPSNQDQAPPSKREIALGSTQLYAMLFEANALLIASIEDPRNNLGAERFPPRMRKAVYSIKTVLADPRYGRLYENENGVIDSKLYRAA